MRLALITVLTDNPCQMHLAGSELHKHAPDDPFIEGYTDEYITTSPVMKFKANDFGLYDMSGNVWQYCEDRFIPQRQDVVLRGGSWIYDYPEYLSASFRFNYTPVSRFDDVGFRCVWLSASSL